MAAKTLAELDNTVQIFRDNVNDQFASMKKQFKQVDERFKQAQGHLMPSRGQVCVRSLR